MKRLTLPLVALAIVAITFPVIADDTHSHGQTAMPEKAAVTKTLLGEVVDTGCYLGHEAKGEKHIGCATKCINGGMPMGLLTDDGTLYLITLNHDNADPYNQLKGMAGKRVTLTGSVMSRGGMNGVDVTGVKLAEKPASK